MTDTTQAPQAAPMVLSFDDAETDRKLAIICSKGSLDMAYPGLILANAALGRGSRDSPVLHLLGLRHDQQEDDGRPEVHALGNTATHMPQASAGSPASRTWPPREAEEVDRRARRPEVPEFLDQIAASGGHLWACKMSPT